MSRSLRLRFALVLAALLPGLFFRGGETMRLCLHDWIDFQDGCEEVASSCAPSVGGSCCATERSGAEEPALARGHECQGCCIEIGSEGGELSTPPAADGYALLSTTAMDRVVGLLPVTPLRRPMPRTFVPSRTLPGRAPTPLRI